MPYTTINKQPRASLVMAAVAALLLGIVLAPSSQANLADQQMFLTFSAPVEIPGMVLPAGTYSFTRLERYQNPDQTTLVRIADKNGTRVFATLPVIPAFSNVYHNNPTVDFYETRGSAPPAIKDVYYAGTASGHQFIYRKGGPVLMALTGPAMPAAPAASASVVPEANAQTAPPAQPANSQIAEAGRAPQAPAAQSATPAPQPQANAATQPVPMPQQQNNQLAQATPAPQAQAAAPAAGTQKKMPRTASELPLLAVLAMVSLAAGAGLRSFARQKD